MHLQNLLRRSIYDHIDLFNMYQAISALPLSPHLISLQVCHLSSHSNYPNYYRNQMLADNDICDDFLIGSRRT